MVEYCKNCGAEISADDEFCHDCGHKIDSDTITCKNCGQKLHKDVKFCNSCGHPTKEPDRLCPNCGKTLEANQEFCSECGNDLNNKVTKTGNNNSNKKLVIIGCVLVVIVALIAAIVLIPGDSQPEDVGDQEVEVGSTNFLIPGDYKLDPSSIDVDYKDSSALFSQAWVNDEGDELYISTMTVPYYTTADDMIKANGGVEDTKMGYDGYYVEKDDLYMFSFETGGYVCLVGTTNPNTMDEITCLG